MARPSCIPHYTRSIVIYCSHALTCTHGLLYNNDTTIIYNVCSSGLPQVLCKSCGTPNWWHMVVQSTHIHYVAKGCRKRGRERDCTFLFALMLCTTDNVLMSTFLDAWNLSYKFTQSTQNNTCAFLRALKASRLVEKQSATRNLILRSHTQAHQHLFHLMTFAALLQSPTNARFFHWAEV